MNMITIISSIQHHSLLSDVASMQGIETMLKLHTHQLSSSVSSHTPSQKRTFCPWNRVPCFSVVSSENRRKKHLFSRLSNIDNSHKDHRERIYEYLHTKSSFAKTDNG